METKKLIVGLVGNPNSGKSTLFNQLTGGKARVGNWPGVTVEKKEGKFQFQDYEITIVDLPGIYSLTAHSIDEKIARDFILEDKPDGVVVVVDASNLERNLYLVAELLELGVNVLVALNMMDVVRKKGIVINLERLSQVLGVTLVETVASKGEGVEELKEAITKKLKGAKKHFKVDYGEDIEREIEHLERKINTSQYPLRWAAIKLLEEDREILDSFEGQGEDLRDLLSESKRRLEEQRDYDLQTALVERRYGFISGLVRESVSKKYELAERLDISDKIDRAVINRYLGIPIFLGLMWLVFQFVFTLGGPLSDGIDAFIGWVGEAASSAVGSLGGSKWLSSLVSDGIISGVGAVLVFLPFIFLLFFAITILEGSGYLARAAFVMDRFMHALGLQGKSCIPMILGFGCNIPAIMAARTVASERDRILTILVIPFMSCSARLTIYTLFAGAFFAEYQGWVVFSLYLLGIIIAILVARLLKGLFFRTEDSPLIMELPPYRMPSLKFVLSTTWERGSLFLKRAGTKIFLAVVFVWLLSSLPAGVEYASKESLIGQIGSLFAPLFEPAGFGFWQSAVALLCGILAKEVVVGTLGTLYGAEEAGLKEVLQSHFTPLSAYAFMVMSLLYIPCVAAVATIIREANWRWALLVVGYSLLLGWTLAVVIYQVGRIFI